MGSMYVLSYQVHWYVHLYNGTGIWTGPLACLSVSSTSFWWIRVRCLNLEFGILTTVKQVFFHYQVGRLVDHRASKLYTLVGPPALRLVLDPLAVKLLNNRLYIRMNVVRFKCLERTTHTWTLFQRPPQTSIWKCFFYLGMELRQASLVRTRLGRCDQAMQRKKSGKLDCIA